MLKFLSKTWRVLVFGLVLINFVACGSNRNNSVRDNDGLKIVSLAPSNTEILVELSLGDKIIGIDKYSTDVEGVNDAAKIFESGSPNMEALAEMAPDIIFLSQYDPSVSFDKLEGLGIKIVNIDTATNLEEIYNSILLIGNETNKLSEANSIVENLRKEVDKIKDDIFSDPVNVYFEISAAPYIYSIGNDTFINEIIEISGGKNIFGDLKGWISPNSESIIEKNPKIIFTNVSTQGNIDEIKSRVGWENIDAVRNGNVYYIDNNSSSRPSQFFIKALQDIRSHIKEFINE